MLLPINKLIKYDNLDDEQKELLKQILIGSGIIIGLELTGLRKKILSYLSDSGRVELIGFGSMVLANYIKDKMDKTEKDEE